MAGTRELPKNVVFLVAAIQAFLVSFPSLLLSVTNNSDKDAGLKLIFDTKEMDLMSTPGLTKELNEMVFWTVTGLSVGYYRIYVDGAMNQSLFVFLGGFAKLGAACQLMSWYLQGHAKVLLLVFGVLPEACFGIYFLTTWWGLRSRVASPNQSSSAIIIKRTGPKNLVFGYAAIHLFLIAFPSFLLSITENTDKDFTVKQMMDADALAMISTPGVTRGLFRMFNWLLACLSIGFYRVYMDGAMQQPLMVFNGALGKLGAGLLLLLGYVRGTTKLGVVCCGVLPDLVLCAYFVKVWLETGAVFAPPKGKQQ